MTNDRLKAIKKLIGCNCEWESFCIVGELMEVLNNEQNRAEQAEASCAAMRGALEYYAGGAKYVQRPDGKVPISDDGGGIARATISAGSSAQDVKGEAK